MKIRGHDRIEQVLATSISSGKIFPTWIFCGPFGVGKSSVAYKFAKCLLSGKLASDKSLDLEDQDPIHNMVSMRTHPDFFVLEQTDASVSIDEIRDLMLKIRRRPTMSKWRVVIIENASGFNKNIYNSLLKILEEPPENTAIILICENTGHMPKTLLSRASQISFSPLSDDIVKHVLDDIGIENSSELAKMSGGSVGYAISLRDHDGLVIYDDLLKLCDISTVNSSRQKTMQRLIDNDLTSNFKIIKEMLLQLLSLYVRMLTDTLKVDASCKREISAFQTLVEKNCSDIDAEVKKVLEIIFMLNKCEMLMLDKSAMLVYVFEKLTKI